MDHLQDVLELLRRKGLLKGRLRGVLHIAIGRTLSTPEGRAISRGMTWRELANLLRDLRFDPAMVSELGLDPETLSPRDRLKFWYSAIGLAKVDSPAAFAEAEKVAASLKPFDVIVGPPPSMASKATMPTVLPTPIVENPPPPPKPAKSQK